MSSSHNKIGRQVNITIDKVDSSGMSIGRDDDKLIFCRGALPGEKVIAEIVKHKKGNFIGDVVDVLEASPHRVPPREDHYVYCGLWQMMDYAYQVELKKKLLKDSFFPDIVPADFSPSDLIFGYRTKIEYGFMEHAGRLSFSLRGHNSKVPTDKCLLASSAMNAVAEEVLRTLRENRVNAEDLKSLAVRESKSARDIVIALYVKEKKDFGLILSKFNNVSGLIVAYSAPDRLLAGAGEILWQEGIPYLTEKIGGLNIDYPFDAFFQNNIPLFNRVIGDIKERLDFSRQAVEFYGGVGAIGLYLNDNTKHMDGYEISPIMVDWANRNADKNNIGNYRAFVRAAENVAYNLFVDKDLVIINPPRKGLSMPVLKALLYAKPKQIIYLSCNHETQSRDYNLLKKYYNPMYLAGYDFYPNTPFIESLLILEAV